MSFIIIFLLFFFVEIILELGLKVDTKFAEGLSLKNFMLYGMLVAIFFMKILSNTRVFYYRELKKFGAIYIFFFFYAAVSILYGGLLDNPNYSQFKGVLLLKSRFLDPMLSFFVFAYFLSRYTNGIQGLRYLLIAFSAMSGLTFLEVISGYDLYGLDEDSARPNGPLGEPNQSAAVMAMCIPILASLALNKDRWFLIYVGCIFGLFASVLVTGSRGGMLAIGVGMCLWLFFMRKELNVGTALLVLIAAPLLGLAGFLVLPEYYQDLLFQRLGFLSDESIDIENASAGRTTIWEYAINFYYQQPLLGWGYAAYSMMVGAAPHNTYLDVLISYGLLGVLLYLFYLFRLINIFSAAKLKFDKDMRNIVIGVRSGIFGIFAALFFLDLYMPSIIFWALLGAAAAAANDSYKKHLVQKLSARAAKQ